MATRTNIIECPFCGYEHTDFQNYVDPVDEEADFSMICEDEKCGAEFHVDMQVTTTFKTTRL